MKKKRPFATPELLQGRLMLSLKEWCQLTGTPRPTGYKLAASNKIPGLLRVGSTIRISTAALQAQLAAAQPGAGGAR